MHRILPIILCLLLFAAPALATTWYADNVAGACAGNYSIANRNCSGTDGTSYAGLDAALQAVTCGVGDTIIGRAGTYVEYVQVRDDGSPAWNDDAGCSFETYNSEVVTLDHDGSSSSVVRIDDGADGVSFDGFTVTGAGGTVDSGASFIVDNASETTLTEMVFPESATNRDCIKLTGNASKVIIHNPDIDDCGRSGVQNYADEVKIYGDTTDDCTITGVVWNGITGGDQASGAQHAEYHHCTISNSGRQGIQHQEFDYVYIHDNIIFGVTATGTQCENDNEYWLVKDNTYYDNGADPQNGEGNVWIDDCAYVVVEGNKTSGDSMRGIYVASNSGYGVVTHSAIEYVAVIDNINQEPPNATYWAVQSSEGSPPAWDSGTQYYGYNIDKQQIIVRNNIVTLIDESDQSGKKISMALGVNADNDVYWDVEDVYFYHNSLWMNGYSGGACEAASTPCGSFAFGRAFNSRYENIVFKNNIISEGVNEHEVDLTLSTPASVLGEFDYNIYYRSGGVSFAIENGDDLNLADWKTDCGCDANSTEHNDPDDIWVDEDNGNFTPMAGSPLIDAADWLTTINEANATTDTITLADSRFFHDGMGIGDTWAELTDVPGDCIKLASGVTATITSTNYTTHEIVVDSAIAIINGEGVSLCGWEGAAPDVGAVESGTVGGGARRIYTTSTAP